MKKHCGIAIALMALFWSCLVVPAEEVKIKDTESTTHGEDAARHQIVDTYKFPGFEVVQVNLPVLSHYSYLLVSGTEALVVDPDRDVQFYLEYAENNALTIKGVYLTHSHADFVAGHLEIANAAGCPIYQSSGSGARYAISSVVNGSTFTVGTAIVKILETPGHTPDGTSGLVLAGPDDKTGQVLFSGDTLFIGSVGRPDLLEGKMTAATLAAMGFDTWQQKLSKLDDAVLVLPAHGAGSLCGAHLSDQPKSTLGAERLSNPYLQIGSRAAYVTAVLRDLPEAPQYFKHNAALNRLGPPLVDWKAPLLPEVKADSSLMDTATHYLVDIRDQHTYAAGHIPGAVNISLRGRMETWVGIMVPWEMHDNGKTTLVATHPAEMEEARKRLARIGYEASFITMENWKAARLPVKEVTFLSPAELYRRMKDGTAPLIVDVRLPSEWMGLRIGEVVNLPLNQLAELSAKLDPTQPVVAVCNSAYRSSMAIGILEKQGFQKVTSLAGGSEAWIKAEFPVYGTEVMTAAGVATAKREIRLAERMAAEELRRLVKDLPGSFDVVDIRPPDQFKDYHVPDSRNADLSEILTSPAFLVGAGPLVIVDRDGTIAMQVAGILSQKTERIIKVLYGGLEAYWRAAALKDAPHPAGQGIPTGTAPLPAQTPREEAREIRPATTPPKARAGC